jgi:hypothetical protein
MGRTKELFFAGALVVGACTQASSSDTGSGVTVADGGPCAKESTPPSTLACAGLYADIATKQLAPGVEPYAPASPLWSDGAEKTRFIVLPQGKTIDIGQPNEWVFPVGTKLFKEFAYRGKRLETRLFHKTKDNYWVHATYKWNADDTAATISFGETIPLDHVETPLTDASSPSDAGEADAASADAGHAALDGGVADAAAQEPVPNLGPRDLDELGTWQIPTPEDCEHCHRGRTDRILGFEQVNLGLDGAKGLTLAELASRHLVAPAPTQVALRIGDDGTGLAAPALAWLHTNCGVTCHNDNSGATGYGAKMVLRLDPASLDGTPPTMTWAPLATTVGVAAISGSLTGARISPGEPDESVIVELIHQRGELQMPPPPLSRVVDTKDVAAVIAWIRHMKAGDAGVSDAGPHADGGDAGH